MKHSFVTNRKKSATDASLTYSILGNRALWHRSREPEGWDVAGHELLGGEKKEESKGMQ